MERGRRFPKAVRYNVQMEYSQPLGWISRTPEGKFVLDEGFTHPHEPVPSSQVSLQGSFRSHGSGQSGLGSILDLTLRRRTPTWWPGRTGNRSPRHWKEREPEIQTIYEPRAPRYRVRTSSPGPIAHLRPLQIEDVSSVLQPSSVERSFPSTVSSHFTPNRLRSPSYELPSLRILHEQLPYIREEYEPYRSYAPTPRPQQVQAEVHHDPELRYYQHPPRPVPISAGYFHYPPPHSPMQYSLPVQEMGMPERGRHIPVGPTFHPQPRPYGHYGATRESYYRPQPVPRYVHPPPRLRERPHPGLPRRQMDGYEMTGVELVNRISRPTFADVENQRPLATSSPPHPDPRQVVRVLPASPMPLSQHGSESSSEDRPVTYTREQLQEAIGRVRSGVMRTERPFRHSALDLVRGPTSPSPATTVTTEEEPVPVTLASPNGRTSVTSASSGRGSKHSRGDSLQGDLEYSPSSSSGFASRNTSQSQPSPHAVVGAPVPQPSSVAHVSMPPYHRGSPHHPRTPLDLSVDENYEFDSVSPLESDLLDRLRQHTHPWPTDREVSDSELYTNLYPRPKKPSKYDNIEIERRIPALKEEFQQFRRRQQERRQSEELESEC